MNYELQIYDEHMTLLAETADPEKLTKIFGIKDQKFYLKVTSSQGSSQQQFYTIKIIHDVPLLTDPETEYNDALESANLVTLGRAVQGYISHNKDLDAYKIVMKGDGFINFVLENIPEGKNYGLSLYKGFSHTGLSSNRPGNQSEYILNVPVKNNDVFYVRIFSDQASHSDAANPYNFLVFPNVVPVDDQEYNDTKETATDASGTSKQFQGTIHSTKDVDYYRITNNGLPYELEVSLSNIPAGMNYELSLIDEAGVPLEASSHSGNGEERVTYIISKNKTYYVSVFSGDAKSMDPYHKYTLNFTNKGEIPVILVPGFGGSVIFNYDKYRKETSLSWITFNVNFQAPTLSLDRPEINNRFDVWVDDRDNGLWGISDISPVEDLFGQDLYLDLMINDFIGEGYVSGKTLFGMPYNFVRDNTESAQLLKNKIDLALSRSGANKVMLVSHSNGGLIIKEAIMDSGYADKVAKWVTLGTPWLGAPAALKAWIDGYDLDIPILNKHVGRELAIASPTAYGLIPSPSYMHLYSSSSVPVLSYNLKNEYGFQHKNIKTFTEMYDFLKNVLKGQDDPYLNFREDLLDRARNKHATIYDLPHTDVPLYIISGDEMPTVGGYYYNQTVADISDLSHDNSFNPFDEEVVPHYLYGDGTVPLYSSRGTPNFRIGTNNTTIYSVTGVKHMPLVRDDRNREQVKQILVYGNENPVADLQLVSSYQKGMLAGGEVAADTSDSGVTATVLSVPLNEEAELAITHENGEKSVVRILPNQTYIVERQAAGVTTNEVGGRLWLTMPVQAESSVDWSGSAAIKVYDLQNSKYVTSFEVDSAAEGQSFKVSNSKVEKSENVKVIQQSME